MDIKTLVNLALENRTPNEKVAIMCLLTGKKVEDYAHLDNGRKSMTAGNVLRAACKDVDFTAKLIAKCGLSDIDLDSTPANTAPVKGKAPSLVSKPAPRASAPARGEKPSEPIDANYPVVPSTKQLMIPMAPGVWFAHDVLNGSRPQ